MVVSIWWRISIAYGIIHCENSNIVTISKQNSITNCWKMKNRKIVKLSTLGMYYGGNIHMLNSNTKFVCNQNSYVNDINIV